MEYTRYEKARIISARALQISEGAPILVAVPDDVIDPVEIAELEFNAGILPITSKRDAPKKEETKSKGRGKSENK